MHQMNCIMLHRLRTEQHTMHQTSSPRCVRTLAGSSRVAEVRVASRACPAPCASQGPVPTYATWHLMRPPKAHAGSPQVHREWVRKPTH